MLLFDFLIIFAVFLLFGVINVPLVIVRIAFSRVATILLLPVFAIVHGISCYIACKEYNNIYQLEGSPVNNQPQSFGDYLKDNDLSIDDITIKVEKNQHLISLRVKHKVRNSECRCSNCVPPVIQFLNFFTKSTKKHNLDTPSFSSELNKQNAPYIKSFFRLNMDNVAGRIENATNIKFGLEDKKAIFAL
jgi:hypothetical protein